MLVNEEINESYTVQITIDVVGDAQLEDKIMLKMTDRAEVNWWCTRGDNEKLLLQ